MKQVKKPRLKSDKTRRKSSEPSWNKNFIDAAYKAILRREADPDGLEHYLHLVSENYDYSAVLSSILESQEFVDKQLIRHNAELLVKLTYSGLMNRLPDAEEILYWVNFLKQNGDFPGLVCTLAKSVEVAQHLGTVSPQLPPDHCSYDRPALVFLHIAKTGGSTLQNFLIGNYGEATVYHEHDDTLYYKSPCQLAPYSVFAGHFNHDSLRYIPRHHKTLLTIVREPVARLVSLYNYLRAHEPEILPTWSQEMDLANQLDILEFFEHPKIRESISCWNHMTWVVMGDQTWRKWRNKLLALTASRDLNARAAFLKNVGLAFSRRLSEFFWVGIQEDYDASLSLLFSAIELPQIEEIPVDHSLVNLIANEPGFKRVMSRQDISEVSPRIFELIELDLILYKKAKAIFAKRVKAITR